MRASDNFDLTDMGRDSHTRRKTSPSTDAGTQQTMMLVDRPDPRCTDRQLMAGSVAVRGPGPYLGASTGVGGSG